jgi:hypothetical protein
MYQVNYQVNYQVIRPRARWQTMDVQEERYNTKSQGKQIYWDWLQQQIHNAVKNNLQYVTNLLIKIMFIGIGCSNKRSRLVQDKLNTLWHY